MVDTHGGELGIEPPVLPAGREVELPGRGRTFVRQLVGPPGAPTVVLLHGWTATADLNWVSCYRDLARQFNVVALDHRGHGRGLRSNEPFRLADCADDVAALVDELGVGPVTVVGYSMGGPIAQLLWRRHRDVVAGLVLCATSCTFGGTPRETILFRVADGTAAIVGHVPLAPLTKAAVGAVGRWRALRGKPWWGFAEVARHDWAQVVEAGRELGRFDSRPWIDEVDVPTAIVVTDLDDVVPVHRQLDLSRRLADASVHRVAGGHAVCTLDPGGFLPALLDACHSVTRQPLPPAA
ncbi:MAG TPA: alpha/beta hydrolase [Desertimonas sp.]|nr:alpha/beta hydrolase [Desertimonas sp.]